MPLSTLTFPDGRETADRSLGQYCNPSKNTELAPGGIETWFLRRYLAVKPKIYYQKPGFCSSTAQKRGFCVDTSLPNRRFMVEIGFLFISPKIMVVQNRLF